MSDKSSFARSAADFDAALSRMNLLEAKTTAKGETYLNLQEVDPNLVDSFRFPKNRGPDFITPLPVSLRTNLWGAGWLAELSKLLRRLDLGPQDTLVQLSCGDGRWLVESACMRRCNCIGYEDNDASDLEYRCGALAADREVEDLVEFVPCDDVLEADIAEATAVLCMAKQERMSRLREKLESELDPFTPVVVMGGEVVGWTHQWSTKHRGVPMYLYERRLSGPVGNADVHDLREEGNYGPNDRLVSIVSDGSVGDLKEFHLEDLGSRGRADPLEGSLDRSPYTPNYVHYVHTPHDSKKK